MPWFALYTRPRHEKKVHDNLLEKEIPTFLPLGKELRQWKDRRRWIETPLFPGYVFVNINLRDRLQALQTQGVVRLVGFGGEPTMIPDWQVEQLMRIVENAESICSEVYFKEGDLVEITEGALAGIKGYFRESRGESRIAVLIDGIYQSTSFIVQKHLVKKVDESSIPFEKVN